LTPKDTELHQISAKDQSKVFKKYFFASQYTQSELQDTQGIEDVVKQVLDEHQRHADDLLLLGEGTSGSDVVNNGLFYSGDSNYVLEGTPADVFLDDSPLLALHNAVIAEAIKADLVAGRKIVMFYGTDVLPLFNGLHSSQPIPFKRTLGDVLGGNYSMVQMPPDVTPASANGFIIANLDKCKLHYTGLPSLKAQGVNEEKMYSWHNFMMGSMMVDVQALNACIRQPVDVAATNA
jgi:hypothetical protein